MKRSLYFIILISNFTYSQVNKPEHDPPLVINAYSEVLAFDKCKNEITINDPFLYKAGDTVLLIQMMGVVIDISNSASFGNIIDYKNAGNYEMNYIVSISANRIALRNKLTRGYDIPDGKVQLIRVPYIKVTNYVGEFTCMPWDGSKGGVLVLNCDTVDLKDDIDVSAKGFRRAVQDISSSLTCSENNYTYPSSDIRAAFKGESIATISSNISKGKGSPANGGGGGLSNNSGGGGGGNAGMGGFGGYQCDTCGSAPFDNRGVGGKALNYSTAVNKIFMGGGGGAGHAANISAPAPYEGTGGGIAIIIAENIRSSSLKILANGGDGITCNAPGCNDGMYGGGAGGTVVLFVTNIIDSLFVETKGGAGANVSSQVIPGGRVGPGGGGGGGLFFLNRNSMPGIVTHEASGGVNGTVYFDGKNPWGATSGTAGFALLNLPNPWDTELFKPNIDSVRLRDSVNYCNSIKLKGLGFTNSFPIASWQWYFGDGGTSIMQNSVHNYNAVGNYDVKLIVTDIKGCQDSTIKTINTAGSMFAEAGADTAYCASGQKTLALNGSGTGAYSWTPAAVLNNNTLQNPTATINTTTKFYLNVSNGTGCAAIDSVTITINQGPIVKAAKSNDLNCNKPFAQLNANGATTYTWLPAYALSNDRIANPIANPAITTTYYVFGKDTGICAGTDSIKVIADFKNHGIILPNSFTPDNNGINDCFGIKYYRDVKDFDFTIFNRYGTAVFKTSNPDECWDGKYKGKSAGIGSYVYIIKAKTLCGNVFIQDNLMLIR
jgi:gliding motility-associated-like protein